MRAEPAGDMFLFEVPGALSVNELLGECHDSVVVPRLRSSGLGTAITVGLDVVGGTSGVVQLLIARHELGRFGRKVLDCLRGRDHADDDVSLELTLKRRDREVSIKAHDPDERFVEAVLELVQATREAER